MQKSPANVNFSLGSTEEAQKTLEESMAMSIDDRQELALELYRSRHGMGNGTLSVNGGTIRRTLNRKQNTQTAAAAASLGKSPPRPSPASVAYHSDEESLKCYDENPDDTSSVTEKPSEVSSSDSQVGCAFHFFTLTSARANNFFI